MNIYLFLREIKQIYDESEGCFATGLKVVSELGFHSLNVGAESLILLNECLAFISVITATTKVRILNKGEDYGTHDEVCNGHFAAADKV